jgi:hypothetical protein
MDEIIVYVYMYNYVYMCDFAVLNWCKIEMRMCGTPGTE